MNRFQSLFSCVSLSVALFVSACSGGAGEAADASVDASVPPDALVRIPLPVERIDLSQPAEIAKEPSAQYDTVNSLVLAEDGTLAFCITGGAQRDRVGFIDSNSEEFSGAKIVQLSAFTDLLARNRNCKMSIIEDHAYAVYYPSGSSSVDSAPIIVKMSLSSREVVAVWEIPEEYFPEIWLFLDDASQGLEASEDPNKGYLMISRFKESGRPIPGISVVTVDLESGAFSEEVAIELDDVQYVQNFSVVDGRYLFGLVKQRSETTSQQFMLDLVTQEKVWRQHTTTPQGLTINRDTKEMLITDVPSGGWQIFDYLTGDLIQSYEYITGGYSPYGVWMPGDRIAHLVSGSSGDGTLTIVRESDGAYITDLFLPFTLGTGDSALVASPDGKYLFVGGSTALLRVTVPGDLP